MLLKTPYKLEIIMNVNLISTMEQLIAVINAVKLIAGITAGIDDEKVLILMCISWDEATKSGL